MISEKAVILGHVLVDMEQEDDGSWHAEIEGFKGLHTCGATQQEAWRNATDAAIAYLMSCQKHGDPIPLSIHFGRSPYAKWPEW